MQAAEKGHAQIVDLLLKKGANADLKDRTDSTALSRAAEEGHVNVAKLILDSILKQRQKREQPKTIFFKAAREGRSGLVPLILDAGVDLATDSGTAALVEAAGQGHLKIVQLLLAAGAKVDGMWEGQTALHSSARKGHVEIVKLLLQKGADPRIQTKDGDTILMSAAIGGNPDVLTIFKRLSTDHTIVEAAILGDLDSLKRFIKAGSDLKAKDREGRKLIMWAIWGGHPEIVKLLLDYGATLDKDDLGAFLMMATGAGHTELAKLLLDRGADVNATDNGLGATALMESAGGGHLAMARLLLDKGADVEGRDQHSITPLMWAVGRGHLEMVKLLLDRGADVNAEALPLHGGSVLQWAARHGHSKVVKLLLEKGANINAGDEYRWIHSADGGSRARPPGGC